MRASVLRRVRSLADAQLGVVTSAQLRAAGIDLELPRREGWPRLAHGVWVVHDDPVDEQLLEGLGRYAPQALASGALACRWLGLRHAPDTPGLDALVPHGTTLLGGTLLRPHQTRRMPTANQHREREIAPAARAVADTARWTQRLQDARAVVLAALADQRVEAAELAEEDELGARRTSARLRTALQDWERGARSAPEAEAADTMLALPGAGPGPAFLLNPGIWLNGVLLGSPDGWVAAAGLGWEIDSVEYHGSRADLDATLLRHQRFSDAGLELTHVTPGRMRMNRTAWGGDVAARAARRATRWQAPAGLVVVPRGPVLGGRWAQAA